MNLETFAELEHRLGVRRTAVLGLTLYMTWRAFAWAAIYVNSLTYTDIKDGGVGIAAMIAAVTAPIAYLQKAVFETYVESKKPSC